MSRERKHVLDAEAHSMLVEARSIIEAAAMGVAHEEPHREFAVSWLRRLADLNRRYYENAVRNGHILTGAANG